MVTNHIHTLPVVLFNACEVRHNVASLVPSKTELIFWKLFHLFYSIQWKINLVKYFGGMSYKLEIVYFFTLSFQKWELGKRYLGVFLVL